MVSVSKGEYRYGMNTQEKDNEIYGEGNSYSAEYWQYDARLGRRWNVDPVSFMFNSPYSVLLNSPILFQDSDGDIIKYGANASFSFKFKTTITTAILRLSSPTFRGIYKDLKKSPNIHTINSINSFFSGMVTPNYNREELDNLIKEQQEAIVEMLGFEIEGETNSERYKELLSINESISKRIDVFNKKPKEHQDGTGCGTEIYLNFKNAKKRATEKGGGRRYAAFKLIGHEFSHAHESNKGNVLSGEEIDSYSYTINSDGTIDVIAKFIPYEEKRAHSVENQIISEINSFLPKNAKIPMSKTYDSPEKTKDNSSKA